MIIDAHQHFWRYQPQKQAWISEEMSAIRRDFMPDELAAIYKANKIDGCVAVQVEQNEEENEFFLQLTLKHSFIKGIVGWVDFRSPNIAERLEFYSALPPVKGFRHIVQGESDRDFLLGDFFCRGIALLKQHAMTYDILIYERQLPQVAQFVKRFPEQPFIIDHIAKPAIRDKSIVEWKKWMTTIASHGNVYCKLSGMVTEADWRRWTYEDLEPYMDVVLETFGPQRMVYGSDWPVCLVAASYEKQMSSVMKFIDKLTASEKTNILGENAIRFYHL